LPELMTMFVTDLQGGAQAVPPIPKMDAGTPGAPTAAEIRQQVREIRDQARQAARDAATLAKTAGQTAPPPPPGNQPVLAGSTAPRAEYPQDVIPPQAVDISIAFFVTVAICVIGFPLSRAFGRLLDRRSQQPAVSAPDLTPQLRQLQESVDAMAIEMERISEGQRFTSKLLAERSETSKQG
jgi:hypothetical protein